MTTFALHSSDEQIRKIRSFLRVTEAAEPKAMPKAAVVAGDMAGEGTATRGGAR